MSSGQYEAYKVWDEYGTGEYRERAKTAPDYHAKKFDQGKADWTLLPPYAASRIVGAVMDCNDNPALFTTTPDGMECCAVAQFLFDWRSSGDVQDLKNAFLGFDCDPLQVLAGVVTVLEYGARKYARDSWRTVPDGIDRYYSAAMRHLNGRAVGEELDPESGLPHLHHAACNIVFLIELTRDAATP